jgi:hypothetical protein
VFVRLLSGESLSSDDVPEHVLRPSDFRDQQTWRQVRQSMTTMTTEVTPKLADLGVTVQA